MSAKYKSKVELVPWMSASPDNVEKRFIQVGNSLLFNKEFQSLGAGSQMLYLCMSMESAGKRRFIFPQAAAKSIRSPLPVCGVMLMNWRPKDLLRSTPVRQLGNPIYMNFATTGRLLLAPGPAPLPWLYLVKLTQSEPSKTIKKSHWLCHFE